MSPIHSKKLKNKPWFFRCFMRSFHMNRRPKLPYIPRDVILMCILPRLPVESLIRFKSVSKSWQNWISSPEFIRLHRQHAHSSDNNRFLVMLGQSDNFSLHELDLPSAPPLLLPYPIPMSVDIVASCGFLLLSRCFPYRRVFSPDAPTHATNELVLLNPSTGSYHEIPRHCTHPKFHDHNTIYGLYFDEANDTYKVATIISKEYNDDSTTKREITVYSSKTNLWTLIEKLDTYNRTMLLCVAVIGHLLHTIFLPTKGDTITPRIVCFDIVAEQWTNDVPQPDKFEVDNLTCYRLCVLDGFLCGGVENLLSQTCTYQVWVMKEYGVKESWVKLLNIDTSITCGLDYLPVSYREGSRHEILCQMRGKLFSYDIRSKKAEMVEFDDGCRPCFSGHIVCKQSLFEFAGGQRISLRRLGIKEVTRKRGSK